MPMWDTIIHSGIFAKVLDDFRTRLPDAGFHLLHEHAPLSTEELHALAPKAEVVFGPGQGMDAGFFSRASRLKVVSLVSSGPEPVDVIAATRSGVVITHTPEPIAEAVADLTWGLLLGAARRIPQRYHRLKYEHYPDTELGMQVYGKTLGIVGLGFIGKAVARRAQGFAMRLLAWSEDEYWDADFAARHDIQRASLHDLLRQSDFVSLHMRATPLTHRFIGADELALMKRDAILVNTARAELVDEQALYDALQRGVLAGAATDVNSDYGRRSPLLDLPNVICTPHIGGRSRETALEQVEQALVNARGVMNGERPARVINPEVYDNSLPSDDQEAVHENH
ncbi:MAG: D-glycerate dehydrogenase [Anaerolineae bacterium]|nr:D-glycerate dehydrogenase [Anaerolineae bacterium]